MPASCSSRRTSRDDTRCSAMTFAASRTVAVVATATGSRPTRSRTRVLRMALPVDDSCSDATAPLIRLARWASKKASTSGWSVHSRWKSSAGRSRARQSSMAVTSKVDGLPWVRLVEPKQDPSPPRSTRLPWASRTSAAPERSTTRWWLSRPRSMSVVPRRKYVRLIRAGRASSTASGSTSKGSWRARKSRTSDSSTSRAMPPSSQRWGCRHRRPRAMARPARGIPRRTGTCPGRKAPARSVGLLE